MIIVNIILDN